MVLLFLALVIIWLGGLKHVLGLVNRKKTGKQKIKNRKENMD